MVAAVAGSLGVLLALAAVFPGRFDRGEVADHWAISSGELSALGLVLFSVVAGAADSFGDADR